MGKHKMPLYFVIVLLGILLGGQGIRLIHSQSEFGNRWVNERYRLAMNVYPSFEGPSVFVIGASEVESGFDPRAFDRAAKTESETVKSYNFGFRNMSPRDLGPLIEQMDSAKSPRLSIDAIYLKFSPADLTEASERATVALNDEVAANILSRDFLIRSAKSDFRAAVKLLAIKDLQGGYSSTNLNTSLRSIYLQVLSFVSGRDYMIAHPLDEPRYQLWASSKFNAAPAWDAQTQGFHDRSQNGLGVEAENLYRVQNLPDHLKFNFFSHERRSQITSLVLSPRMVADLQEQLQNLRKLSKNVTLFYLPDHPELPRSRAALDTIEQVFHSLCESTQVRCIRFDKPTDFTARDYYDACHLNPAAVERFSLRLAEDFRSNSAL